MTDSIEILVRHVAATLPDSITQRLTLLEALRAVMKDSHPAYDSVCEHIQSLQTAQMLQAQLPLIFNGGAK
jgi:hypothetical protein